MYTRDPRFFAESESDLTDEPDELLVNHGERNLVNEIELLRHLNLIVLRKMNAEKKKLSFQEYLTTLRTMTYSAGRIAHLAQVQYRVFSPRLHMEQTHKMDLNYTYNRMLEVDNLLMGDKEVRNAQFDVIKKLMQDKPKDEE